MKAFTDITRFTSSLSSDIDFLLTTQKIMPICSSKFGLGPLRCLVIGNIEQRNDK